MIGARSFIDILFILLLGMLVMLTRSVEIGAVETELLRVGAGGVSPIAADRVQLVAIGAATLSFDTEPCADLDSLDTRLDAGDPVLLVASEPDVPFRRVMDVWSFLRDRGHAVSLGAAPTAPTKKETR